MASLSPALLPHAATNNPSDAGYWINALDQGFLTSQAVADRIARSPEGLGLLVDGLYRALLNRAADPDGRDYFVAFLGHGGTVEQASVLILSSPESAALVPADDAFVQSLYRQLLGRTGSAGEVNGWVTRLPELGRAGVAAGFLASSEFRALGVEQLYGFAAAPGSSLAGLFPDLLERPSAPAAVEVDGWVRSGRDLLALDALFAESREFLDHQR